MLAGELHHGIVGVVVVLGIPREVDGRVHQERAKKVEDPGELVDGHRAQGNEDAAEDQGQDDADQQGFLLIEPGHFEAGHDDQEDEQVVHRQAVLGEPARVELQPVLAPVEEPHPQAEGHRKPYVDAESGRGFAC
ncbi:Uncharacterised protein [Mycobacteroides abscessus subsp. abscessus]|nr:Uncharacterised protein [Mycobacteroides abscessus subsp. abscessus]SLC92817.1 Uncharacterised protein [Mycobacteroides abscessus subsp. massiliense]